MTARGLTSSASFMNVPFGSENGPNDIAFLQPRTSTKNVDGLIHVGHGDAGVVVPAHARQAVGHGRSEPEAEPTPRKLAAAHKRTLVACLAPSH